MGMQHEGEIGNGTIGTDVISPVKVESGVTSISTTANTVLAH